MKLVNELIIKLIHKIVKDSNAYKAVETQFFYRKQQSHTNFLHLQRQ
jgi:hypothetical protein